MDRACDKEVRTRFVLDRANAFIFSMDPCRDIHGLFKAPLWG